MGKTCSYILYTYNTYKIRIIHTYNTYNTKYKLKWINSIISDSVQYESAARKRRARRDRFQVCLCLSHCRYVEMANKKLKYFHHCASFLQTKHFYKILTGSVLMRAFSTSRFQNLMIWWFSQLMTELATYTTGNVINYKLMFLMRAEFTEHYQSRSEWVSTDQIDYCFFNTSYAWMLESSFLH